MASIYIIGTRGVPNRYGGFERLVEVLAPYLASKGHDVTVFCAAEPSAPSVAEDHWHGVRRRYIRTTFTGGVGTLQYDLTSFREVPRGSVAFAFGYGTALFQLFLKVRGIRHCVNMDGFEWRRAKWSFVVKHWLRMNEWMAARLGDVLIADHPEIQAYLTQRYGVPSEMIAYGVDLSDKAQPAHSHALLDQFAPNDFFLVIARPEPENQVHVVLDAYRRSGRRTPMLVIGDFTRTQYGRHLKQTYSDVTFTGPIYDAHVLDALRARAALYLHGHSVGGTNPSLIEAMAAGALIAAHDNQFNRWVIGNGGLFFSGVEDLSVLLTRPVSSATRAEYTAAALRACKERFMWSRILSAYEKVLDRLVDLTPRGENSAERI